MLGKRPPQIQRTTSMSQLRVPPGARTSPASDFAQAKKDLITQMAANKPAACTKKACTHHMHPKVQEDAPHVVDMVIEGLDHGNKVSVDVSPMLHMQTQTQTHMHVHGHSKASPLPLKVAFSSQLPLLTKHAFSESFMDVCYSCKKPLGHGRDIFMYRGDTAFCTEECRLRQIAYDEGQQKCLITASESASDDYSVVNPKSAQLPTPAGAL
eukprot:c8174_g1_i1 orf=114-746(+)